MFYKVITKKISLVEADDFDEAKEKAYDGDFIVEREGVTEIVKITSSQMRRLEVQLMED